MHGLTAVPSSESPSVRRHTLTAHTNHRTLNVITLLSFMTSCCRRLWNTLTLATLRLVNVRR